MVLAADGNGSPPPPLELALLCGDNFLPDGGGIHDQDYATMLQMRIALNVYQTVRYMRSLTGNQINTHLTSGQRILLGELYHLGILGV